MRANLQQPRVLIFFIALIVILTGRANASVNSKNQSREQIQLLQGIYQAFKAHYAPIHLKASHFNAHKELSEMVQMCRQGAFPTNRKLFSELQRRLNSSKDAHLKIAVESTAISRLPWILKSFPIYKGNTLVSLRTYVAWISPQASSSTGISAGDEVLLFNGQRPWNLLTKVIDLKKSKNPYADIRRWETRFTEIQGNSGLVTPSGSVQLRLQRRTGASTFNEFTSSIVWQQIPELIELSPGAALNENDFSVPDQEFSKNVFIRGRIASYLPRLNGEERILGSSSNLEARITKIGAQSVGVLRIGSFESSNPLRELAELKKWTRIYQSEAEVLVVDLTNNPGGLVGFSRAIAAHLTNKPLPAVHFERKLTPENIRRSHVIKALASKVKDDMSAGMLFGFHQNGYPVNQQLVYDLVKEADVILSSWSRGKALTEPISLDGVAAIAPISDQATIYSKPILIITDSTTMSAGEFFTADLKDSGRARVLGIDGPTAGGGGTVRDIQIPNALGLHHISLTEALAVRTNGRKIEELGVEPDFKYVSKIDDYIPETGQLGLKTAILKAVNSMLKP